MTIFPPIIEENLILLESSTKTRVLAFKVVDPVSNLVPAGVIPELRTRRKPCCAYHVLTIWACVFSVPSKEPALGLRGHARTRGYHTFLLGWPLHRWPSQEDTSGKQVLSRRYSDFPTSSASGTTPYQLGTSHRSFLSASQANKIPAQWHPWPAVPSWAML